MLTITSSANFELVISSQVKEQRFWILDFLFNAIKLLTDEAYNLIQ